MDTFKNINWHPALEDIIDTVFIDDERMKRESAMYKIMSDNFTNPFEGIEHEYAKVDIELIKHLGGDELEKEVQHELKAKNIERKNDAAKHIKEQNYLKNKEQKSRFYIPGIRKPPFKFPRGSNLNKIQQAMCLRVLLRFSNNENKIEITKIEKTELQNYMSLREIISKEQTEFLDFAKSKWNETAILFKKCPGFVRLKWAIKMHKMQKLPKYYAECTNVPFCMKKDVKVKFVRCLQQELASEIKLPKLDQRKLLNVSTHMLRQRFISTKRPDKQTHFVSSVSEDMYCEDLAIKAKVDLVISSSGLKCLLNNIDTTYSNSWLIPVVIKSHNGKTVIYIDKRLPPTIATTSQKNTWVYKYVLRYYFIKNESPEREKQDKLDENAIYLDDNKYKDSFDELLKSAKEHIRRKRSKLDEAEIYLDEKEYSDSSTDYSEIAKENKSKEVAMHLNNNDDDGDNNDSDDNSEDCSDSIIDHLKIDESDMFLTSNEENKLDYSTYDTKTDTNSKMIKKQEVSYRLFTIETQSQDYDERRDMKEYKILVRSKLDGIEKLLNGESCPLILSPKMEHQIGFGAEAATLEENLHEWTSLIFRPEASLARIRIDAGSSEVIQIERHTTISLNSEIKRLHNVKAEDSLKILYNVIEKLSMLTPGRYIIRHIPKHGPFAHVYKETDKLEKNILNLDTIYESKKFETSSNTPWQPIDKILTTPWIKYCNKMPAMFNPPTVVQNSPRCRGHLKKSDKTKQEPIRRSLRKKKAD